MHLFTILEAHMSFSLNDRQVSHNSKDIVRSTRNSVNTIQMGILDRNRQSPTSLVVKAFRQEILEMAKASSLWPNCYEIGSIIGIT